MLIFKQPKQDVSESLTLAKVIKDRFNANRVIIVSDSEDENIAKNETFKAKDILKKYGFNWDNDNKTWWMNSKFKPIDKVIETAKEAVKKANEFIGGNNEANELITKLEDVMDAVQKAEVAPESAVGKDEVIAKIQQYINELADEVDEVRLSAKLKEYFDWLAKFPGYSFYNQILIYVQKRGAKQVNSKSGWEKLGYKPKEGATDILIWRPTLRPPSNFVKDKRKEEYIKKYGNPNTDEGREKMDKYINETIASKPFILYPVYDITDVVNEAGESGEGMDKPELQWYDEKENEVADKIFDAMLKVYDDYNIKYTLGDSSRGERGVSKGGSIGLLKDAKGISKASTAIHEFAHELMHQSYLKTTTEASTYKDKDRLPEKSKHILDAYVGRSIKETMELQAESTAYVVLKSFGVPGLEYATNYIALWKGNKASIIGNLDIITTTSNIIIKAINKHIDEPINEIENNGNAHGNLVTYNEVANLLQLDLSSLNNDNFEGELNEIFKIKKTYKSILNS